MSERGDLGRRAGCRRGLIRQPDFVIVGARPAAGGGPAVIGSSLREHCHLKTCGTYPEPTMPGSRIEISGLLTLV